MIDFLKTLTNGKFFIIILLCKIGVDVILLLRHAGKIHKLQKQQVDHLHKNDVVLRTDQR